MEAAVSDLFFHHSGNMVPVDVQCGGCDRGRAYSLTGDTCVESVEAALNSGVRLIDTAYMYHNEESVGEAVRNSGIPREEIFVITKLYPNQFSDPEAAIEEALAKLDIDYIDMMLLPSPRCR